VDAASTIAFRAESNDIRVVADLISNSLFGGIPFSPCTSERMGAFPAVRLDREMLGLSVYLVHMNSRDAHEFTLELECDDPTSPLVNNERRTLLLTNGLLLSDFVAERLRAISDISVSS